MHWRLSPYHQQQKQALSEQAMASIAGPTGGMQDNPMGNIDMNELSAQDQQLVGAMYGLPQGRGEMPKAENGFDPFDFKMALREASDEKVRSNLDKLLLFCYNYEYCIIMDIV